MKNKTFKFLHLLISAIILILAFSGLENVSAQLADSPWPLFGHDSRHTNVSPFEIGKDRKELLWSYKTGSSIESSPVIGTDGTIYVGSHDGFFYAFNKDGSVKWKVKLTEPSYDARWNVSKAIMASPAIASDGTVYINTASGYLHALIPSGNEKWRFPIRWSSDFWNSPNIGPDGTIYIGTARHEDSSSPGAGLVAINPDGTEKWRSLEASGVTIVPSIADDGTIVFGAADVTTNKGKIISLDPGGKKKWEFWLEEWLEGSSAVGSDGTIFSGSKEGNFYALNPNGTEKWRFKTGGGISSTPTVGNDGNVYIGSWDGNFYAFDQKTGEKKWQFDVKVGRDPKLFEGYPGKETITTNSLLSKDGVLIFADVFDTVYAVDTAGKEVWRWKSEDSTGFASSPAISQDGVIYIGGEGGYFYALGEKEDSKSETSSSTGQNKSAKSQSNIIIYFLAAATFVLILAGVVFALYSRKKKEDQFENQKLKTLLIVLVVTLFVIVIAGVLDLFYPLKQDSETKDIKQTSTEKVDENQNEDEFTKNAIRIPGPVDIWVREFGEVGRHCIGKGCGGTKDTCVRWNKTKDNCYETVKTMPATSDRYKIYCNMVIVNQDQNKAASVSLNLNYTTADGEKHLVQKGSETIEPQSGKSLGWSYDVDANSIGQCGYSDLVVKEGK